jgi:Ca2+-transporting ATPase
VGSSSQDTAWTAAIQPNPGEEHLFNLENNPFAFSPGHLSKLIEPKSIAVLQRLGGLPGLERGLRTDIRAGLSIEESRVDDIVTIPESSSRSSHQGQQQHQGRVPETRIGDRANTSLSQLLLPFLGQQKPDNHYADRRRIFGENCLPERKSKSFLALAWIALQDRVLILLSVAAAVSLALGLYRTFDGHHEEGTGARVEWAEGVAIIVAILVVVIVGALNDWQKERRFYVLNKKKEERYITVIRSGKPAKVSVHDVLVGDVMILEQGDVIPVDGVLIQGYNVSCDEASSTGESDVVKKLPAEAVSQALLREPDTCDGTVAKIDPFLLSGARVVDGVGTYLVTAVGPHSSHGRAMMALRNDPGMTPLQARLNVLAGRHILSSLS